MGFPNTIFTDYPITILITLEPEFFGKWRKFREVAGAEHRIILYLFTTAAN